MDHEVPPEARPLLLEDPSAIGEYRVLGRLGFGGMGVVYLAAGPGDGYGYGPMVAIKTLHPWLAGDRASLLRFRAERDFGRRVSSFCIPHVLDDDMDGPRPYIVTEFVPGVSLAEQVQSRGPLTGDTLEAVAIAVAAALLAIHTAGLAHRDLKPANVLLSPHGPKLIDFSIASELESADRLTQTNIVMGSPGWIAPERLTGGLGTCASDVFGWGCVVAFAATGLPPFGSGTAPERTELILSGRPELGGLPEPWRLLVTSALAQDPEVRPGADDLLHTLLATRGRSADPSGVPDIITDLWTLPAPVRQAAPEPSSLPSAPSLEALLTAPPEPRDTAAAPPGRRNTVAAWAITAVAVAIAVAATVGSTAQPPPPAGPHAATAGPKSPPTTSARTSGTSGNSRTTGAAGIRSATPVRSRVNHSAGVVTVPTRPAVQPAPPKTAVKVKTKKPKKAKKSSNSQGHQN